MLGSAECTAEILNCKHVAEGVDAALVESIKIDQAVAYLVRGVGEQQDDLLGAACDTFEADGEAVTAEYGENNANGLAAEFGFYVCSDVVDGCIVAIGACDNSLGDRDDVAVIEYKIVFLHSGKDRVTNNLDYVVALADNGSFDTSGNC